MVNGTEASKNLKNFWPFLTVLPSLNSQYGEFRRGYEGDEEDVRIVWYGIRYVVENFVARQWTMKDVEDADAFYATHQAPMYTAYPYPRELFEKFIMENNGYMPVKVQALPEGTAIAPHVPVFQVSFLGISIHVSYYDDSISNQ